VQTIAGMGNAAWNGGGLVQILCKGTTGNKLKILSPANPGTAGALGTVTYSKSDGAAISEIRLDKLKMYSGANSLGLGTYSGRQVILDSECGATIITNGDGGSTEIGIEVIDSLDLGNRRTAGFLHAELYTSGNCNKAGVWIKGDGGRSSLSPRSSARPATMLATA
jgi:hypothetical protein